MKKTIRTFCLFSFLISFTFNASAQDSSFYDNGWLDLMRNNYGFNAINDTAAKYYADTSSQKSLYNFHKYNRWQNFWKNRVHTSAEDSAAGNYGMFFHQGLAANTVFGQEICINGNHPASNWESWAFHTQPFQINSSNLPNHGGQGIMFTVRIDTADPNLQTIYAGSPLGGLWKTIDQGNSWFNISDQTNLPSLSISDIAIDPKNNQHLLVSTGTYWSFTPPGLGVIESFDGGQSWDTTGLRNNPVGKGDYGYIDKVYFHPNDTNKYYAFAKNKLLLSIDKGVIWDSIIYQLPDKKTDRFKDLKFHPLNPDTFYVSAIDDSIGILRTFNGGVSFSDITSNFYTDTNTIRHFNIDVSASKPDNLYASLLVNNGTYNVRVFKSVNLGNNAIKTHQSNYLFNQRGNNLMASDKSVFMVSPTHDSLIIMGGVDVYRTNNSGSTFLKPSGLLTGNMHDDIRGGDYVGGLAALATDGGISISTNDGTSWARKDSGLAVQQIYGHSVDKDFTYMLAGMQDIGSYVYNINSKVWEFTFGSDGGHSLIYNIDPTKATANQWSGGISGNNGLLNYTNKANSYSWGSLPLTSNDWYNPATRPFAEDHLGNIYSGGEDLYKSSTYGASWSKITDFDGTGFKGLPVNDFITAIAISKTDTNTMALGFGLSSSNRDENNISCNTPGSQCPQKKLLVSNDGGTSWVDRTEGSISGKLPIGGAPIADVIISPHDAAKIWVVLGSFAKWQSITYKVYYSPDTGHTWLNHSYDLPNYPAHSIVYQPNSNDRLYLATDAGVFTKDAAMTSWDCYNTNLPPTYCVDLDVNNCGGALTLSTQGRGAWKSPLAPNRLIGDITWDGHRTVGSDIIVQDTLTITGTVEMAYGTKITVEPGGKLLLAGGTLTNSHCIDSLWQGIELLGDPTKTQTGNPMTTAYPQGYVKVSGGGIIENAEIGIHVGSLTTSGYAGGLINFRSSPSKIRNCRRGIVVTPYSKHNRSYYKHGTFENDGSLTDPLTGNPLITEAHVSLDGTNIVGNLFEDLTFKNHNLNLADTMRGIGIELTGRKIGSTSNLFVDNCEFENLRFGIRSGDLSSGVGNDIENNTFSNNRAGIYILSGYSAEIKNNTFTLADVENEDVYAIMLADYSSFDVRENTINGNSTAPTGSASSFGIIVENSGAGSGIIFDNTIGVGTTQLETGIQSQGDNQSLSIRCNDITYNGTSPSGLRVYDYINQTDTTLAKLKDQGHSNCINSGQNGDDKAAAGNEWLNLCSSGSSEEVDKTTAVVFAYYWHTNDVLGNPTTEPNCSPTAWNTNLSLYVDCDLDKTNTSCDDLYAPPGGGEDEEGELRKKGGTKSADTVSIAAYVNWYTSLRAKKTAMEQSVNGAFTEAVLVAQIKSSSNDSILQAGLNTASPISERVIAALIEHWSSTKPTALQNILLQNLPLSKASWQILNEAGLGNAWINALVSGTVQHALRDSLVSLERELRYARKKLHLVEAKQFRAYRADSLDKFAEDVLDTSILSTSLRLLAKDFVHRGEYLKANALFARLNVYDYDGEQKLNQAFVQHYLKLMPLYQQGKSAISAPISNAELKSLMQNSNYLGSEAEAIHQSVTKEFKHHPIMRKRTSYSAGSILNAENEALHAFNIYPNPNNGRANIAYELSGKEQGRLQVFDIRGKLLVEIPLAVGKQQKELNISSFPNGIYHFSVILDNERLFNGKIVVSKP